MADINTLLGLGVQPEDNLQALADQLRGQQRAGQFLGLSQIEPIKNLGNSMATGASDSAQRGGVLNQAMAKEATRKTEREQDYQRGLTADSSKQKNAMALQAAKGRAPQSFKSGNPEMYENIKDPSQKANIYFDPNTRKYRKVVDGSDAVMSEWRKPQDVGEFGFKDLGTMSQARREYDNLKQLNESFDESFATAQDSKIPFENSAKVYLGRLLPAMFEKDGVMQKSGEWWKDLDKFYNLVERHEMFGGALSKGESKLWGAANINAEATPEMIMRSLNKLLKKKQADIVRDAKGYKASGYNPGAVDVQFGQVIKDAEAAEVAEAKALEEQSDLDNALSKYGG